MLSKGKLAVFLGLFLGLLVSACTWVKLVPEAKEVRIATEEEVKNCQRKGQASVSLKSKVIGVKRSRDKVKLELQTLGRNSAVKLGGNAIVPASLIEQGKQSFDVYLCP